MTDGKKSRQRKKVPNLQELDDKQEDWTGQSTASGKGKSTSSKANRNPMRVRKGVGRKKVETDPRTKPKSQFASKPDKDETSTNQSIGKGSGTQVSSVQVKSTNFRSPKTPPETEVGQPPKKSTRDEEAQDLASQKAEKRNHQMGPFKRLLGAWGRNRIYESKCVKCSRRAIAKVVFYKDLSDRWSDIRAHGDATEDTCFPKPRRRHVTKTATKARLDTKVGGDQFPRQTGAKSPSRILLRPKKPIRKQYRKIPAGLRIAKPSPERVLGDKARDEARRKAKERGHRISEFVLFAYPEADDYTVYRGRCEKCHRTALGMVKIGRAHV